MGNWVQEWFGCVLAYELSYAMLSVSLEMVFRTDCAQHGLEIADLRPVSVVRS